MTETRSPASGQEPEGLVLRGRPRPVTRFNRKILMVGTGLGSVAIFGATMLALHPPSFRQDGEKELYNLERKAIAEGLAGLPRSYGDIKVPRLGPPLAGDLGPPIVRAEREAGVQPNYSIRPSPEDDAARAERLRLARKAQQAREAGVFFQVSAKPASTGTGESRASSAGPDVGTASEKLHLDLERDQNYQQRKLDFMNARTDLQIYNPHRLQEPVSPYQLMTGTVIAASLVTGINSDLPGSVKAQVTENVYDTVTGRHLLIPQGSHLIGKYDSVVAFGQSRALVVWNRIVLPNGFSVVIENLPAIDPAGYAGLADSVDYHVWRLISGVALSTLLGVGTELTLGDQEGDLVRAIRESAQQNTNRAGQRLTERNLNIQPTLMIRPGWPLRVIVQKDLVLQPYVG